MYISYVNHHFIIIHYLIILFFMKQNFEFLLFLSSDNFLLKIWL